MALISVLGKPLKTSMRRLKQQLPFDTLHDTLLPPSRIVLANGFRFKVQPSEL